MTVIAVPPDAPFIVHAAASAVLALHVGGGTVGMASGSLALLAGKGSRLHRLAGNVFFVSMLALGVGAVLAAPFIPGQEGNLVGGIFVIYLVSTAWATVRRGPGKVGWLERLAIVVPLLFAALIAWMMVQNWGTPKFAAFAPSYPFAIFALLAAYADFRMIRAGGISGAPRVRRHLWRMSTALAIALGSFFLGQQKFLPEFIRGNPVLFAPMLINFALMIFWMIRTRSPRRSRPRSGGSGGLGAVEPAT